VEARVGLDSKQNSAVLAICHQKRATTNEFRRRLGREGAILNAIRWGNPLGWAQFEQRKGAINKRGICEEESLLRWRKSWVGAGVLQ
jgi:hypothetical protein